MTDQQRDRRKTFRDSMREEFETESDLLDRMRRPRAGESIWWAEGIVELASAVVILLVVVAGEAADRLGFGERIDRFMDTPWVLTVPAIVLGVVVIVVWLLRAVIDVPPFAMLDRPRRRPSWLVAGALLALVWAPSVILVLEVLPENTGLLGELAAGVMMTLPGLLLFGYTGLRRFLALSAGVAVGIGVWPLTGTPLAGAGMLVAVLAAGGIWSFLDARRRMDSPITFAEIMDKLASADESDRLDAAEFLIGFDEPRAFPRLARLALADDSAEVREAAGAALYFMAGPVEDLMLEHYAEEARLDRMKPDQFTPDVISELHEDRKTIHHNARVHDDQRAQVVRNAVGDDPELVSVLVKLAKTKDERRRPTMGAEGALALLGDARATELPEVVESIIHAASSIDDIGPAAYSLTRAGLDHISRLTPLLDFEEHRVRKNALFAVGVVLDTFLEQEGDEAERAADLFAPRVLALTGDDNATVRKSAASVLRCLVSDSARPKAVQRARELLEDGAATVRAEAVKAVVILDGDNALGAVETALGDQRPVVRQVGVEAVDVLMERSLLPHVQAIADARPSADSQPADLRLRETARYVLDQSRFWDVYGEEQRLESA